MTASINQSFIKTGVGQFFLSPYPVNLASGVMACPAITTPGSAYTSAPTLTVTGGTGAGFTGFGVLGTGTAAGTIVGIIITNPGVYTVPPTAFVLTGGGFGVAATITGAPVMGNPAIGPVRDVGPAVAPAYADYIEGFFQEFYGDPKQRRVLRVDSYGQPWGNIDANGLSCKVKQNGVEYDANNAPKVPIGVADTAVTAEITFADVDPNHLADVLSATLNQKVTIAPSTGKAGRMSVSIGGSNVLLNYTAMYRMPSVLFPGEFDHFLYLRPVIVVDTDLKLSKKDTVTCKIKITCLPDKWLINPDTGTPELAVAEIANAAGL